MVQIFVHDVHLYFENQWKGNSGLNEGIVIHVLSRWGWWCMVKMQKCASSSIVIATAGPLSRRFYQPHSTTDQEII